MFVKSLIFLSILIPLNKRANEKQEFSRAVIDDKKIECCGWAGHVVSKAGQALVHTVTAPTQAALNAAQVVTGAKSAADILQPFKDAASSNSDLLKTSKPVLDFLNAPSAKLYAAAGKFAEKLPAGPLFFDLTTFTSKFYSDLAPTSYDELILLLKGQNPLVTLASPLAAAIHAARDRHALDASPLPKPVAEGLKRFFTPDILAKAKFVVGKVELTLPNLIGQGRKIFMGDHFAVVVDDIIVFPEPPPSFEENPWWWGHEVNHIKQYTEMGVELFAYNYMKDAGKTLEGESNAKGDEVLAGTVSGNGQVVLTEQNKIFKSQSAFQDIDNIIWQCTITDDKVPASYVVTKKGKILAVDPLSGEYVHIGYAEPPIYAGSSWTFKTSKVTYAVTSAGIILEPQRVVGPEGKLIRITGLQVGTAKRLDVGS